jgi:ArsR family transcriptional regulator
MELVLIYKGFSDKTRLRILNLLSNGALCVCHFQTILGQSQVRISKHLAYLKNKGLVVSRKHHNWMIYSLPAKPSLALKINLKCLLAFVQDDPVFKKDLKKLKSVHSKTHIELHKEIHKTQKLTWFDDLCCCGTAKKSRGKPK